MFGARTWDTSLHDFLRLRVRSSGDGLRYFVNIQTDGPGELHDLLSSDALLLTSPFYYKSDPTSSNTDSGFRLLRPTMRHTSGQTSSFPSPTLRSPTREI